MKTRKIALGALIGGLVTTPLIAVMFLAERLLGLSFVPFEIFSWVTRVLPGDLVTFGIDLMIDTLRTLNISVADTAKTAEQAMAIGQFLGGGIVFGGGIYLFFHLRNIKPGVLWGIIIAAIFGAPAMAISLSMADAQVSFLINGLWLAFLFLLWGHSVAWVYKRLLLHEGKEAPTTPSEEERSVKKLNRRQFLITMGAGAATITVVGAGLGTLLSDREDQDELAQGIERFPDPLPLPNEGDPVSPVEGTRPEYTPVEDHYKVFIGLEPENIDGDSWTLPITGLVDNPLELSLEDLQRNYPTISQYVTLSCISGRIPTTLISTTFWTGVSVQEVLEDAQVQEEAEYLFITSEDGFYETVPLDLIYSDPRIMFCYAWDGEPLPKDHGYPLRIWLPDRFGMKQPKWITSIELIGEYKQGYWVERNWDRIARIKTRSVIDTVNVEKAFEENGQRFIPIGGIAFAGARGISKVEIKVDDGPWQEAQLRSPLSDTTWVIWRHHWSFQAGDHTFQVRCYDGKGELQVLEESPPRPDGATGVHSFNQFIQDT